MKSVVLFDADGTLYEGFSIFPLYDAFEAEGFVSKEDNEQLQELLGQYEENLISYRGLVETTLKTSASNLKGKSQEEAKRLSIEFFSSPDFNWFGYVMPMIEEANKVNAKIDLITAEPQFVAKGIAVALGIDRYHSSQFGVDDGIYRGNLITALDSEKKGDIAKRIIVNGAYRTAFGDSEGDIGMFEAVDRPVCINPTEQLRKRADKQGWLIVENPNEPLIGINLVSSSSFGYLHG